MVMEFEQKGPNLSELQIPLYHHVIPKAWKSSRWSHWLDSLGIQSHSLLVCHLWHLYSFLSTSVTFPLLAPSRACLWLLLNITQFQSSTLYPCLSLHVFSPGSLNHSSGFLSRGFFLVLSLESQIS